MFKAPLDLYSNLSIRKIFIPEPTKLYPSMVKIDNHYTLVFPYKKNIYFHVFTSTYNPKLPLIRVSKTLINENLDPGSGQYLVNVGYKVPEPSQKLGIFFQKSPIGDAFLKKNQEHILKIYSEKVLVNNELDPSVFQEIIFDPTFIDAATKLIT
jgi:hypothetical protein